MIRLCRLNGSEVYLNADLVATVEAHHDTVVTLVDGKTYVVRDSADAVVDSITRYRASVLALAERIGASMAADDAGTDADAGTGQDAHPRLVVLKGATDDEAPRRGAERGR